MCFVFINKFLNGCEVTSQAYYNIMCRRMKNIESYPNKLSTKFKNLKKKIQKITHQKMFDSFSEIQINIKKLNTIIINEMK